MASINENRDITLVGQCLSGSEPAWTEFYSQFHKLVRLVVRRRLRVSEEGVEDVVQEVFISLISALKTYDSSYSLQNFVSTIAERVCVDQFRFSTAAKRDADIEPLDDRDPMIEGCMMNASTMTHQEDELILAEQADIIRRALRLLGAKCRELLKLRYYEELTYLKITEILGGTENALTVKAARCIRELRVTYQRLVKKGVPR